jgi:hypothetical protein
MALQRRVRQNDSRSSAAVANPLANPQPPVPSIRRHATCGGAAPHLGVALTRSRSRPRSWFRCRPAVASGAEEHRRPLWIPPAHAAAPRVQPAGCYPLCYIGSRVGPNRGRRGRRIWRRVYHAKSVGWSDLGMRSILHRRRVFTPVEFRRGGQLPRESEAAARSKIGKPRSKIGKLGRDPNKIPSYSTDTRFHIPVGPAVRKMRRRDGDWAMRYLRSDFWNIRSDFSVAAFAAFAAAFASAAAC